MKRFGIRHSWQTVLLLLAVLTVAVPLRVAAHCDTTSGPVVQDARRALESGDVTPVLKWIAPADEATVRAAFHAAVTVRRLGEDAQALADQHFFETVVRIHRAGEGAPYEGLKDPESVPALVVSADQALAAGSADALVKQLSALVAEQLRTRYQQALQRRAHAEDSPEAGRQYVAAYVDYVHFVEAVHELVEGAVPAHPEGGEPQPHRH